MSVKVTSFAGEDFDNLLRRFRRAVNDANILGECKKREFYLSKPLRRREKSKAARLKAAKAKKGY